MLLGGLLVALGVVAGAVADRIRAGRHRVPAVAPARARVARGTHADTKVGVGIGPATAAWVVPGETKTFSPPKQRTQAKPARRTSRDSCAYLRALSFVHSRSKNTSPSFQPRREL
jgi:hypothetical protein